MDTVTFGIAIIIVGAAGISAYPMAARVVQAEGRKYEATTGS